MEHPLIGDINDLTVEQLTERITDLHKKLGIAARSCNAHLSNQIRMALETYQNKYQQKLQEQYQAQTGHDFDHKINIER